MPPINSSDIAADLRRIGSGILLMLMLAFLVGGVIVAIRSGDITQAMVLVVGGGCYLELVHIRQQIQSGVIWRPK